MLYHDRIDISDGIHIVESNKSKERMTWKYCFFNDGFKFHNSICNGSHDLTMLSVNRSNIACITVMNFDYCCIIHNISESEAINLLKNSALENCGYIKNIVLNFSLFKTVFTLFV